MNWEYIHEECQKLDIAEFEGKSRKLALKLFSSVEFPELDADEQKMLDYYLGSGTYGTVSNSTNNKIKKFESETGSQSKVRFLLHRVFPPMEHYENYFPFFYKHKILLPIGWAYRLFRGIFCKKKVIQAEMKAIRSIEKTQE